MSPRCRRDVIKILRSLLWLPLTADAYERLVLLGPTAGCGWSVSASATSTTVEEEVDGGRTGRGGAGAG